MVLWKKQAVCLFILLYLYQAILLALSVPPEDPEAVNEILLAGVVPTIRFLGIYHHQRWFAPNPPKAVLRVGFELSYDDGTTIPWGFSRHQMSWGDPPESFRRYLTRYVIRGGLLKNPGILRDLTAYIARANDTPLRHPTGVQVFKYWGLIHPPPPHGSAPAQPTYRRRKLFYSADAGGNAVKAPGASALEPRPSQTLVTDPVPTDDDP